MAESASAGVGPDTRVWAERAVRAGDVVAVTRRYVAEIHACRAARQVELLVHLRDVLSAVTRPIRAAERRALGNLIAELVPNDPFGIVPALTARIGALTPADEAPAYGRAQILFVAEPQPDDLVGVVRPLYVGIEGWGELSMLQQCAADQEFRTAFDVARSAATHWLGAQPGLDGLGAARGMRGLAFTGTIPHLDAPVHGASVGLGAAAAFVSAALDLPLPSDVAWTGRVEADGCVSTVDGMREKLRAAADAGMSMAFVPVEYVPAGAVPNGAALSVVPVARTGDAFAWLFTSRDVARGVTRFRERLAMAPGDYAFRRERRLADIASGRERRVLVTCIGGRDPWTTKGAGAYVDGATRPGPDGVGAALTLVEHVQPDRVIAMYTVQGKNDNRGNFEAFRDAALAHSPSMEVESAPLESVDDPTDFDALQDAMSRTLAPVFAVARASGDEPGTAVCINGSSGTQQMQIVLLLLAERFDPSSCLLQVREPRWLKPGEHRVRQFSLPRVRWGT